MTLPRALAALMCCWCLTQATGQGFEDITLSSGLFYFHTGGVACAGVSFVDFNGDGYDDLSFSGNYTDPAFLINNQDDTFSSIDLGVTNDGDMNAIQWVDYDNDGDKDLFVAVVFQGMRLYENDGNLNLTEVTLDVGLHGYYSRMLGASFGDYDNDGWLDLYVCNYHFPSDPASNSHTNFLFHSNGDGTFTDVTEAAGVSDSLRASFQSAFIDFDKDGLQDIFIINDKHYNSNALYRNNGDGTFEDISQTSGWTTYGDAMCIGAGDYDNDADLDIFVTNTPDYGTDLMKYDSETQTFTDIAASAGVDYYDYITWGSLWIDYDCNMMQDLFFCTEGQWGDAAAPNKMFLNFGDDTFGDISFDVGFGDDSARSYACAMGDIDNDGYPDIALNNLGPSLCQLWKNEGGFNQWLKVKLEGSVSNSDGIGAWIHCYADGVQQTRYKQCGANYLGQDSEYVFFGLMEETKADSLVVEWPSGHVDRFYGLYANNALSIAEGTSLYAAPEQSLGTNWCTDGTVELSIGEYAGYIWSTGETTPTITVAAPGDYSVTLTTLEGLVFESEVISVQFPDPQPWQPAVGHETCAGLEDGTASVNMAGVSNVQWDNGQSGTDANGLAPGITVCQWTDQHGCLRTDTVWIQAATPIALDVLTDLSAWCVPDSAHVLELLVSGAIPIADVATSEAAASSVWQNDSLLISGFSPGLQNVQVTDEAGCSADFSIEIPGLAPAVEVVALEGTSCYGAADGTAELQLDLASVAFLWTSPTGNPEQPSDTAVAVSELPAGWHGFMVTDAFGCPHSDSLFIAAPSPLEAAWNTHDISCYGAQDGWSAVDSISGGTPPVVWSWNYATPEGLPAGEVILTATDDAGCEQSWSAWINEPPLLEVDLSFLNDGAWTIASATADGGTPPYGIAWSNGMSNSWQEAFETDGNYTVTVTDANGCAVTLDFAATIIGEQNALNAVAFPNPSADRCTIAWNGAPAEILVFDAVGRRTWHGVNQAPGVQLDVRHWATGLYTVVVRNGAGSQKVTFVRGDR